MCWLITVKGGTCEPPGLIAARLSIVSMISTIDITAIVLIAPARQNAGSLKTISISSRTILLQQGLSWGARAGRPPIRSEPLGDFSQCGHPRKSNPLVVEQLDQPLFLERRKCSTHGFCSKAEIIRDIAAAHWQEHRVARSSVPHRRVGQHQDKGDDAFARRLASQEHHLVLSRRQLMRCHSK